MFGTEYFHGSSAQFRHTEHQDTRRAGTEIQGLRVPAEEPAVPYLKRLANRHKFLLSVSSASLIAIVLAVCLHFPHLSHAALALSMVLCIIGIGMTWSWTAALAASVLGGVGFDYYFPLPSAFNIRTANNWELLGVLLTTAIVTGQLASRPNRRQTKDTQRQREMEKLYQLVNSLLESADPEVRLAALVAKLPAIFGADSVALYAAYSGQIVRAGGKASCISDQLLRETARTETPIHDVASMLSVIPIRHGGEPAGSIGIRGAELSPWLLDAIAGRIGMGLAKLYAIERTTQAEVVGRSEELKSAVLNTLTHEIRNPLFSIKLAATTLISRRSISDLQQRELLTIIAEEVDRMDRVINEAEHLASMNANQLSLKKEPQDIAHLVSVAIQEIGMPLGRNRIRVFAPDVLPMVECDRVMIKQALKLLLGNALTYSPRDSPIMVAAELRGTAVVITVVDRGPGVAEDERDLIFEKFYRGRAARNGPSGTGLGLASAKCIVKAHGGEIWVTGAPGGGAAFHLSLPVAAVRVRAGMM
jgi:two-component system sensor histidine kinase KdpD